MEIQYLNPLELAHDIVDLVEERKAEDILLLDLRPDQIIADFFIICSGDNERHLRALTESVRLVVKERYEKLPFSNEGRAENGWVVMDYGDVVVHFFAPDKRDYYGLEDLWDAASKVMLRIQ
ncbi:MAG: ribosome silencing factor [Chloroflexi bacterium]|nr:ribosome silencing factor [Chloroflexota bacterium]